jgi:hypothetical protein
VRQQWNALSMPCLWFGRHKGKPLSEVDTGYLKWTLATVKLSSGTRAAVEAELSARGVACPPAPPRPRPCWMGPCHRCGCAVVQYRWLEQRDGRRQVSARCSRCGASLGIAPRTPPYTTETDVAASPTAVLDALVIAANTAAADPSGVSWEGRSPAEGAPDRPRRSVSWRACGTLPRVSTDAGLQ